MKGRAIIIGDAAHAMLPHQGQGAGQSIEDAEALGTLFKDVTGGKSTEEVETILKVSREYCASAASSRPSD